MPYDFDEALDKRPPQIEVEPLEPSDLESIVTLLSLAAILLTSGPGTTFTLEELLREARTMGDLSEEDVRIVLPELRFLKRVKTRGEERWLLA